MADAPPGFEVLAARLAEGDPCGAVVVGGWLLPVAVMGSSFGDDANASRELLVWAVSAAIATHDDVPAELRESVDVYTSGYLELAEKLGDYRLPQQVGGDPDAEAAFLEAVAAVESSFDEEEKADADRAIASYLSSECSPLLAEIGLAEEFPASTGAMSTHGAASRARTA